MGGSTSRGRASLWRVVSAVVPAAIEDEVASVLGGGSLGVEVRAAGPGRSEVRVYLGPADEEGAWRERLRAVLVAHGVPEPEAAVTVGEVVDEAWVERWQASLAPIPLGRRFVVLPSAGLAPPRGREAIRLVPGMAFGTGEHETTRMCAAALEETVAAGDSWLDLGTGTGILALVARGCGATRVLAVDLDPEAAHVALEVVRANGAEDGVAVRAGSLEAAGQERFDGIVANIQSSFFLARAAGLAAALLPGGRLVVSGVLGEDLPEIEAALGGAGFRLDSRAKDGPWACLVLTGAA